LSARRVKERPDAHRVPTSLISALAAAELLFIGSVWALVVAILICPSSSGGGEEGGGLYSFQIGRDENQCAVLESRIPPRSAIVGELRFQYSQTAGGPPGMRGLFSTWSIHIQYRSLSSEGTLTKTELANVTAQARMQLISKYVHDPQYIQLLLSGKDQTRQFRNREIPRVLGLGACLLLTATTLWFAVRIARLRMRIRMAKRGYCGTCGYDMRTISTTACPECGSPRV
jgi:hypothetical protein